MECVKTGYSAVIYVVSNHLGRMLDSVGRHVVDDDLASRDDGTIADIYAGYDEGLIADSNIFRPLVSRY